MGLFRKGVSLTTAGLVDFRSDKERIARSTRLTKRAVKGQTRALKRAQRRDDRRYVVPVAPNPCKALRDPPTGSWVVRRSSPPGRWCAVVGWASVD